MRTQRTITERVKFLIRHIIGLGIAKNQEDLGRIMGITNKSYLSQLVNGSRDNEKFIECLVNYAPDFNIEWLYHEEIQDPFSEVRAEFCLTDTPQAPEDKIKDLEHTIELLKRDVKYYADIADIRLQTIEVQTKLIVELEKK
jgi:transcriptional regulator with XRE-family HTH domain